MTNHRKIVAITACPTGIAHTIMAAEALKKTAEILGHDIRIETQGSEGAKNVLETAEIEAADLAIVAADIHVDVARLQGKPIYATSTSQAIRETEKVIKAAIAEADQASPSETASPSSEESTVSAQTTPRPGGGGISSGGRGSKSLVAITACPTGIAHTFMAAEALRKAATEMGHQIKVETQGSVGAKNQLSPEDIATADAVIIAADTHVDLSRFGGKRLHQTSTKQALKAGQSVVQTALELPEPEDRDYLNSVQQAKSDRSASRSGPYKHLLTGVSYMLPVVVAGGLIIALSFVFGLNPEEGTFGAALMQIGGNSAFALIVPVLSGYIAFSIADRPGLAPGLIGGMLATNLNMGFLGGIISGFLAGYVALFVRDKVNLPDNFQGLKPVLVIPLLSTLVVGLLMVYVFGTPVAAIMSGLTNFLENMGEANAVLLGLILGGMMAVDMGGPVNKAAYTFAVGLLSSNIEMPMAAVMAAGMTPPLGLSLATFIARRRFNVQEREAGRVAAVLGISFITEGVIPFAAEDPLRVIPSCIAGSAVTGALSMLFGCALKAPHGGVFVLAIPNAVSQGGLYVVAIAAGTLVTALVVSALKPVLSPKEASEVPLAGASKG